MVCDIVFGSSFELFAASCNYAATHSAEGSFFLAFCTPEGSDGINWQATGIYMAYIDQALDMLHRDATWALNPTTSWRALVLTNDTVLPMFALLRYQPHLIDRSQLHCLLQHCHTVIDLTFTML